MSLTQIVRNAFVSRQKDIEKYDNGAEELQIQTLRYLTETAKDTEYGRKHAFCAVKSYEDFAESIPVNTYEELKEDIDRMRHGERDVLWKGSGCGCAVSAQ